MPKPSHKPKGRLLLHACCGPCSLEPLRLLRERGIEPVIRFCNPNIQPRAEHDRRLSTLRAWAEAEGVEVVEGEVPEADWEAEAGAFGACEGPVRQERCRACYRLRFAESARWAADHGFGALGTTLSVSPYQYADIIAEELQRACAEVGIEPFFEDYSPFYAEATRRSREAGMYRQNYCGCRFSAAEAAEQRAARKAERQAARERERQESYAALRTSDFDYDLPAELIAQEPAAKRDQCRLLTLNRATGGLGDRVFCELGELLREGDLLVANETRVRPARLLGAKRGTGGAAEVLLLREAQGPAPRTNQRAWWEALVRPGKRLKPGSDAVVDFADESGKVALSASIADWAPGGQKGERLVELTTTLPSLDEALHAVGTTPLPPYIQGYAGDSELYQTVYSRREGSAAAPTAGLHFTPELIGQLRAQGIGWQTVELEVGLDTFRVVEEDDPHDHAMHTERYSVPEATVAAIEACRASGGRVIAVGTTSVRSLESAWDPAADDGRGALRPCHGASTSLFLFPGSEFHVVDGLITNFHVPRSTLMMLVSAFAGRERIMAAYRHAVKRRYRFLSFGDAMFIH